MDTKLNEKIVKVGSKWQVQSEKGRNMGTYNTKEEAEKRLKQVHYFKHLNESDNDYREKGLQIYYWLEDKGLNVDYSDWGETFYYSFGDEQDYNNAVILLNEYAPDAIMDTDSNRLEIRVDIPTAYEKIKDGVNDYYLNEDYDRTRKNIDINGSIMDKWFNQLADNDIVMVNFPYDNTKATRVVPHFFWVTKKEANGVYGFIITSKEGTDWDGLIKVPLKDWQKSGLLTQSYFDIGRYKFIDRENILNFRTADMRYYFYKKGSVTKRDAQAVVKRLYSIIDILRKNNFDRKNFKPNHILNKENDRVTYDIGDTIKSIKTFKSNIKEEFDDAILNDINLKDMELAYSDVSNLLGEESDDAITEQLIESDSVEDDLEDIIRDTIEENKNENSKISLFEITTEPENSTREKDEEKMYVVDFDDSQVDFRKLTVYPHETTEDGANKPVASFMLGGGLNGSGNWTDYLDDLQKLFEKLKETTGLEPLIYEESTDIADDVWDVKVFMYDHSKDDELNDEDFPLDEGLFDAEPQEIERTNISDSSKNKDLKKLIIFWKDNPFYGPDNTDITWINSNTIKTADWDSAKGKSNHGVWTVNNKGNLVIYHTSYYEPKKRTNRSNFVLDGEYYECGAIHESVDKYLEMLKRDDEDIIIRDEYNENLEDITEINEGLFSASPAFITLQLGDTITTPKNYHNTKNNFNSDYWLEDNTLYEVIQLKNGKYTFEYKDLDHPNVSGASGILSEYDNIEYDSLEDLTNAYSKELTTNSYMINRENPYESYEINYSKDLEKLIDFWNDENVGNFKIEWLNEYQIKTIDSYSIDKIPYIWHVNKNNNVLTVIDANTNKLINRWDSVDTYIDECHELNGDDDENNLDEDYLDETYSKDELDKLRNKVFNQRKIMSIYRKKKYGKKRLMCRTKCVNCGREKKLFLSNLITNPEKYGSCICSDKNIESRFDIIHGLYKGTRRLRNNTSGYTGVSWVSTYAGEPYNKWRAYIDIDGQRNYLGDFSSKSKAIRARKAAAAKGIKWYNDNKNEFMATSRRHRKRNRRLKTKRSTSNN